MVYDGNTEMLHVHRMNHGRQKEMSSTHVWWPGPRRLDKGGLFGILSWLRDAGVSHLLFFSWGGCR